EPGFAVNLFDFYRCDAELKALCRHRSGRSTYLFCFAVFGQASIQRIASLVDTVAEMQADARVVTGLAPIRAFRFFIARPNVEQEIIEDDDGEGRGKNKAEKQERELTSLCTVSILGSTVRRQNILQPVVIPN